MGWNYPSQTWWRHQMETFPRFWPVVRGIHRSPVNSPHKGQWCGNLMFSLICTSINGWVNNREVGDLTRYRAHYDVRVTELNWIQGQFGKTAGDVMESEFTPHRKLWVMVIYPFKTHWGRDKMPLLRRRCFKMHFLEWKRVNFTSHEPDGVSNHW